MPTDKDLYWPNRLSPSLKPAWESPYAQMANDYLVYIEYTGCKEDGFLRLVTTLDLVVSDKALPKMTPGNAYLIASDGTPVEVCLDCKAQSGVHYANCSKRGTTRERRFPSGEMLDAIKGMTDAEKAAFTATAPRMPEGVTFAATATPEGPATRTSDKIGDARFALYHAATAYEKDRQSQGSSLPSWSQPYRDALEGAAVAWAIISGSAEGKAWASLVSERDEARESAEEHKQRAWALRRELSEEFTKHTASQTELIQRYEAELAKHRDGAKEAGERTAADAYQAGIRDASSMALGPWHSCHERENRVRDILRIPREEETDKAAKRIAEVYFAKGDHS